MERGFWLPLPQNRPANPFESERRVGSKTGILQKWTNYFLGWQEKYFVLNNGTLKYYKSKANDNICSGEMRIDRALVQSHNSNDLCFDITVDDCVWKLRGRTIADTCDWMSFLEAHKIELFYDRPNDLTRSHSSRSFNRNCSLEVKKLKLALAEANCKIAEANQIAEINSDNCSKHSKKEIEILKDDLASCNVNNNQLRKQLGEIKQHQNKLISALAEANRNVESLTSDKNSLQTELNNLQNDINCTKNFEKGKRRYSINSATKVATANNLGKASDLERQSESTNFYTSEKLKQHLHNQNKSINEAIVYTYFTNYDFSDGHFHRQIRIENNSKEHSYETIMRPLIDYELTQIDIDDPHIKKPHQLINFIRFCEVLVKHSTNLKQIRLKTTEDIEKVDSIQSKCFDRLKISLREHGIELVIEFDPNLHDREIRLGNGLIVKIGRGLDYFKPVERFSIGCFDYDLRPCHQTVIDIINKQSD